MCPRLAAYRKKHRKQLNLVNHVLVTGLVLPRNASTCRTRTLAMLARGPRVWPKARRTTASEMKDDPSDR